MIPVTMIPGISFTKRRSVACFDWIVVAQCYQEPPHT